MQIGDLTDGNGLHIESEIAAAMKTAAQPSARPLFARLWPMADVPLRLSTTRLITTAISPRTPPMKPNAVGTATAPMISVAVASRSPLLAGRPCRLLLMAGA